MKIDPSDANENMDMPAHARTYNNFMTASKFVAAFVVFILLILFFFLVL